MDEVASSRAPGAAALTRRICLLVLAIVLILALGERFDLAYPMQLAIAAVVGVALAEAGRVHRRRRRTVAKRGALRTQACTRPPPLRSLRSRCLADLLERVVREIRERKEAARAAIEETRRLEVALAALDGQRDARPITTKAASGRQPGAAAVRPTRQRGPADHCYRVCLDAGVSARAWCRCSSRSRSRLEAT
jgi:hypothetical protein